MAFRALISVSVCIVTEKNEVATTASPRSYTKMQLFTSPDYTAELNPTTKVQTDKRLYAQVINYKSMIVSYILSLFWINSHMTQV